MEITHSYEGIGLEYQKTRKGTPAFAAFMIPHAGFNTVNPDSLLTIVELGVGSGQQTEFVEKELIARGLTQYRIFAYDKSCKFDANGNIGQLNLLIERIGKGEISERVIPMHYNFDGVPLLIKPESVHLTYMAHVFHHLTNKEQVLFEIARITVRYGRCFILGVTIEDLKNHPLDEFFQEKYEYDSQRYPTETQLIEMLNSAGFTYEEPYLIGKDQVRAIDRDFLFSIENTTMDSALKMIKDNDPAVFEAGVQRVRREVERAERTGNFRTYFTSVARVFWGIKR